MSGGAAPAFVFSEPARITPHSARGCSLPAVRLVKEETMAEVQIQDGVIKIVELDVQDPKAAAVLAEYPQTRWAEITRRAIKIGLGYLKGGTRD